MSGSQRLRRSRAAHACRSCQRARPSRDRTRPTASRACAAPRCSRTNSSYDSRSGNASACPRADRQRALGESPFTDMCKSVHAHLPEVETAGLKPGKPILQSAAALLEREALQENGPGGGSPGRPESLALG